MHESELNQENESLPDDGAFTSDQIKEIDGTIKDMMDRGGGMKEKRAKQEAAAGLIPEGIQRASCSISCTVQDVTYVINCI